MKNFLPSFFLLSFTINDRKLQERTEPQGEGVTEWKESAEEAMALTLKVRTSW